MKTMSDGPHSVSRQGCLVCGAKPTVKSHLLPRAFAHDARGSQKNLLVGRLGQVGYTVTQSGDLDKNILCHKHEVMLGPLDRYAVSFVRSWRSNFTRRMQYGGFISGVKTDILVRFAASVIWRHGVSSLAPGVMLGDYEPTLRHTVFEAQDSPITSPSVILYSFFNDLLDKETLDRLCLPPAQALMDGHNAHGFLVGGLGFLVKTDHRPFAGNEELVTINGKEHVFCSLRPQKGSPEFQGIGTMLRTMNQPTTRKRPR